MLCWVNGKFVDSEMFTVSPISHGAFYGVNYIETFRTYNGKVIFLESYYSQLCERLKDYWMMMPYSITEIREAIEQLNAQDEKDGAFYIHVTATDPNIVRFTNAYPDMLVLIMRYPVEPIQFYKEKDAIWLQTPYSSDSPGTHIRASFEVMDMEKTEGFFVTRERIVAMGITSIIFWAKDDILYTPSLRVGIYPTVLRQIIISLAEKMGYRVREDVYLQYELEEAHECFIVNSIDEIVPINRIGHVTFAGQEGLLYERLYHAYGQVISRELRRD